MKVVSESGEIRFRVFSTCPQSSQFAAGDYLCRVRDVARSCQDYGYEGILVYYDHGLADPWLIATEIIGATVSVDPLVAVQPTASPPHTVAKMLATYGHLYGRRVSLNLIAGGFAGDLASIGDETPHDRRYDRLREFASIVTALVDGETLTYEGEWYRTKALTLSPPLPADLRPELLMSGSSAAGIQTAVALGATAIQYPEPAEGATVTVPAGLSTGIRVGIIAREDAEEAWSVAHSRFPPDRRGELLHQMAMAKSDSQWHAVLSALARESAEGGSPYWLEPFRNYGTFCPYLVGSYDQVADQLASYWEKGHRTLILDIPRSGDFANTAVVFERLAARRAQ